MQVCPISVNKPYYFSGSATEVVPQVEMTAPAEKAEKSVEEPTDVEAPEAPKAPEAAEAEPEDDSLVRYEAASSSREICA